jgi:diaminopimelate epimerase
MKRGSNINLVKQISNDTFAIRTYERGVEDETFPAEPGATAVATPCMRLKTSCDHLHQRRRREIASFL